MHKQKAISPVVATALLLVVAVTAVVAFQGWFVQFSSDTFVQAEERGSVGQTSIVDIRGGVLYVKNKRENLSVRSVRLNDQDCGVNQNLSGKAVEGITLGNNCTDGVSGSSEVVIETPEGVLSKNLYIEEQPEAPLSCPSGFVRVPGSGAFGTAEFCMMKYEAKATTSSLSSLENATLMQCGSSCPTDGSVNVTSKPEYRPLTKLSQNAARTICDNMGAGYYLPSDREWMTLLRNVGQQPSNWNTSVVGSGYIFSSHTDGGPGNPLNASPDDSDGYYRTGDNASGDVGAYDKGQKRTHVLSTGAIIWDLSGNVEEFNNDTTDDYALINASSLNDGQYWDNQNATIRTDFGPSDSSWGQSERTGIVYVSSGTRAVMRSSAWGFGGQSGLFAFGVWRTPTDVSRYTGFRCAYRET